MKRLITAFFPHMPPSPAATALRGESIVRALRKAIGSSSKDIIVYTSTHKPIQMNNVDIVPLPHREIDNSAALSSRLIGEFRLGLSAALRILIKCTQTEYVIISSPPYVSSLIVAAAATLSRIPYVFDIRDIYPQVYEHAGLLRKKSIPYRLLSLASRFIYNNAKILLTATDGIQQEARAGSQAINVATVYNGYPKSLHQQVEKKRDRFTVCFHGVLGFFQDIETLVEIAKRLVVHEVDLVVVGYGRKAKLLQEAQIPNLQFLGKLNFKETIEEVRSCHVGLCLRLEDDISKNAFPVKVWEYLGLGIPSLVTPHCEAGEFLTFNKCGFQFDAGAVDDIIKKIVQLQGSPDLLQELTKRCRSTRGKYTREESGRSAASLILQALKPHSDQTK